MSIEAMKQALEALEKPSWSHASALANINQAITALRTAIEQAQKQEPCVFSENPSGCYRIRCQLGGKCVDDDMSFRASPPPRQPLTDEEVDYMWRHATMKPGLTLPMVRSFARAIEAAHGIKEST